MTNASDHENYHGRVEILPTDANIRNKFAFGARADAIYRWLPPDSVVSDLPSGFYFDFVVLEHEGMRRLFPRGGSDQMVHFGFLAGIALLARDPSFTRGDRNNYRAMKLIFDRAQTLREHQTRRFKSAGDLIVRRSGRGGGIDRCVIPDYVGKQADGTGRRWPPARLIREGQERAAEAGHSKVTGEKAIAYGLLAAAERNPLNCRGWQVISLLRRALFDLSETDIKKGRRRLSDVTHRLYLAIEAHLNDSQEDFNNWFSGPKSNLMKTIATWSADGPPLTVDEVRWGFLELAWRAYRTMGHCIDSFCRSFLLALPERLNRREAALFRQMYISQRHLGGLSVSLVKERIPLLAPILPITWDKPQSTDAHFVLFRMLHCFADMAATRRGADRQAKRLRSGSDSVRQERTNVELLEAASSGSLTVIEQLTECARIVLEQRGLRCGKCDSNFEVQFPREGPLNGSITIEYWCARHRATSKTKISLKELQNAAEVM